MLYDGWKGEEKRTIMVRGLIIYQKKSRKYTSNISSLFPLSFVSRSTRRRSRQGGAARPGGPAPSRCSGPAAVRDAARLSTFPKVRLFCPPRFATSPHHTPPLQKTHQPRRPSPRCPQMVTSCGPARWLADRPPTENSWWGDDASVSVCTFVFRVASLMFAIQHLAGNGEMEGTTCSLADLDKSVWWTETRTWREYEDKNQEEQRPLWSWQVFFHLSCFIVAVSMEMVNV